MMPWDLLMDGTELHNRLTGGEADRIGIYTSPSIKYFQLDIYAKPVLWDGFQVRIVSQCLQDIKTKWPALCIEGETGWEYHFGATLISRHFPNSEIERYTSARPSIIPYRILAGIDIITTRVVGWRGEGGGARSRSISSQ
jgi:hypothetical protein